MSKYDSTGITTDRYSDIYQILVNLARTKFGDSVNTAKDTYLGHQIDNHALLSAEQNEIIQDVFDAISINNATGVQLANILAFLGIEWSAASFSTVPLTLTATVATTVPAGSQYKTAANVIFATDTELVFTAAGSSTVAATCTVVGPFEAGIGEVNIINTSVYGISTVTNAAAATPGKYRATDADMKEIHTNSVATTGEHDTASIYEAVSEVTGVSAVNVTENDTSETVDGIPANNVYVSHIGGTDLDVATAIANNITASVSTFGSESVDVYNETTSQTKTINKTTGATVPIHIDIEGQSITGVFPNDGEDQIKAAIVASFAIYRMGQDVIYTSLYAPIYSVTGFIVTSLKVDTVDPPTGASNIAMSRAQLATVQTADIDILATPL
jgi:uncharacterized phage protein gp47/JayE